MKLEKGKYFLCFMILFLLQGFAFGQLSNKNGLTYTTEVTVKFKAKAFNKTDSVEIAKLSDLKTDLKSARDFFQKYGEIHFQKLFLNANWGDTIKYDLQGKAVIIKDLSQCYRIIFPEPVKMWESVYALRKLPDIEYADPPTFVASAIAPNDQYYQTGNQWYLSKIQAEGAWDLTTGSSSIKVAVIDVGVDASHPDLSTKITGGESGYHGKHGTNVSGLIGATTYNSIGIASLGWNIMIQPYDYLDQVFFYV